MLHSRNLSLAQNLFEVHMIHTHKKQTAV